MEVALRRLEAASELAAYGLVPGYRPKRVVGEEGGFWALVEGFLEEGKWKGELVWTGRALDLAIEGEGWFVVLSPEGPLLTRRGDFRLSPEGLLVTPEGYPVLGEKGPIRLSSGEAVVREDGTVIEGGEVKGRIRVVRASGLKRVSPLYYTASSLSPSTARVRGGYLEFPEGWSERALSMAALAVRAFEASAAVSSASHTAAESLIRAAMGR
ncbi:MAG TPA: flagellar hook basal-body protein [Armatimonadetes bacterium]|nr:flagellar hook basal-body protein [Armatimonadota bacterium]